MPVVKLLPVLDLRLDPKNYRHMPQTSEEKALHAMAALKTHYFWGLARHILEKGYVETENIVVLKTSPVDNNPLVKEGNRRVAILKLALGTLKGKDLDIPDDVRDHISGLSKQWREKNCHVPCLVFEPSEEADAEAVVDIAHGKAELAARLDWSPVARARHNRDRGESEPALDVLEKYIKTGTNLSAEQKEEWAADYPLSVLAEALAKIHDRLGFSSIAEMAKGYSGLTKYRSPVEKMLFDIGVGSLGFPGIREKQYDFAVVRYGLTGSSPSTNPPAPPGSPGTPPVAPQPPNAGPGVPSTPAAPPSGPATRKVRAVPLEDARAVTRKLKSFYPVGKNREKLVSLLEEARKLKVGEHRFSFCFVLRSMFEISAKAYIKDHTAAGIKLNKPDGKERPLRDVLTDVIAHLTQNGRNLEMDKFLHGAQTELTKRKGVLSIDSLNQLIHNLDFTISETDLCCVFANVFPLLQAMNR
jgi:hypothetical protein